MTIQRLVLVFGIVWVRIFPELESPHALVSSNFIVRGCQYPHTDRGLHSYTCAKQASWHVISACFPAQVMRFAQPWLYFMLFVDRIKKQFTITKECLQIVQTMNLDLVVFHFPDDGIGIPLKLRKMSLKIIASKCIISILAICNKIWML